jgi:hypothetical protein
MIVQTKKNKNEFLAFLEIQHRYPCPDFKLKAKDGTRFPLTVCDKEDNIIVYFGADCIGNNAVVGRLQSSGKEIEIVF